MDLLIKFLRYYAPYDFYDCIYVFFFCDDYFFIEEKSVTLFKITSFKLVLFLTLSIIFINSFGIIGLALADLIVSILITVITFTYISLNLKRK